MTGRSRRNEKSKNGDVAGLAITCFVASALCSIPGVWLALRAGNWLNPGSWIPVFLVPLLGLSISLGVAWLLLLLGLLGAWRRPFVLVIGLLVTGFYGWVLYRFIGGVGIGVR